MTIWIPRGNGKTPFAAAIALWLMLTSGENAMEIYSLAADRAQAAIAFDDGKHMALTAPAIAEVVTPYRRALVYDRRGSAWHVTSSDAKTKHGYRPSVIITDELHVVKRETYEALVSGLGKGNRQVLNVTISTAGIYDPQSLGRTEYEFACKVRDNPDDYPTTLSVIYEAPESCVADGSWADPATWRACNPGLGVTVSEEQLRDECEKAKADPAALSSFLQLRLNIWVNATHAAIDMAKYRACEVPPLIVGRPAAWGGMDLGEVDDMSAAALCWPSGPDEWSFEFASFMPEQKAVALAQKYGGGAQYPMWMVDGWIKPSGSDYVDVDDIREQFKRWQALFDIREIGYDPWHAKQLAGKMTAEDGMVTVEVPPTYVQISEATKHFLRCLHAGRMRLGDSPATRWCASNLVLKHGANDNVRPEKQGAGKKIDPIYAAIIAFARARLACGDGVPEMYRSGGVAAV